MLVAALVSASGPGERYAHALRSMGASVAPAVEGRGPTTDATLLRADHTAPNAALHSAPLTFQLAARGNGGPLGHLGAHTRHTTTPSRVLAPTASRAKLAIASHVDFAAEFAAVRAGAVSSRTTSIPPPLHA